MTQDIPEAQVRTVLQLLEEGATLPFIARYRKEATGSLDEVGIEKIQNHLKQLQALIKRKESILSSIAEQNLLSNSLQQKIAD